MSPNYTFEFYNASHGLPSSEIISLAKDSKGFLWIGTSAGLSRYDGYNFQNFPYTKNNELIGYVNVIKPDRHNRLWIGTGTGLFCYINDEFIKLNAASAAANGVNDILINENDSIWLAMETGPAKISVSSFDFSGKNKTAISDFIIPQWANKTAAPEERRAIIIEKANDGTMYFATPFKIFRLINNKPELLHTITDKHDQVQSLFPVSKEKLFFDCAASEMNLYENGSVKNFYHEILYKPGTGGHMNGFWYAGTMGLYYFHPETGTASALINTMDRDVQYPSSMLQDDNFFWLASHDGLVKIKPSLFTLCNIPPAINSNEDYYAITQLHDGRLLFGSNRGKILEKKDSGFVLLKKNLVPTADIRYLLEDEQGRLWAASSYQGLVLLKGNNAEVYTEQNGLHDNSILFLLKTNNRLFAIGDHGMSEIITGHDGKITLKKFYFESSISRHAKFYSAITAPDGTVWAGGAEGIVYLKNDSLHLFTLLQKELPVSFMIQDKKENIWIATEGNGILQCRFNKNNQPELIKQFTEADGLNAMNYITLLADKENNIWAGSSKGISFIGQSGKYNGRVLNFEQPDGFIRPGYSNMALYQDNNAQIWVTTTFGIASFAPADLITGASVPIMHITGVNELKSKISFSYTGGKHNFPWNQNSLSFGFTALNYAEQEGMQYYYKLDGMDTNWVNTQGTRTISFANLAPGSYNFRVKAINNKGRWSKKEAIYSFTIKPPFWKTWWFRLLSVAALIAAVIFYYRRRIGLIKSKAAIKQQMTELEVKALRAQMNPHFIFNAMNSIQQFTLKNDIDHANLYISRFSALLRKVLHSSSENFITLEEEIEQLRLYLDIEKLRLGSDFNYHISVDEEIETDALHIPGMLVQPFVENALKHGLPLREGSKQLSINCKLFPEEKLQIRITDNGIGRKKAQEIKAQQEKLLKQESKGISLAEERVKLLYKNEGAGIITIKDLYENGNAAGTEVVLTIPLVYS